MGGVRNERQLSINISTCETRGRDAHRYVLFQASTQPHKSTTPLVPIHTPARRKSRPAALWRGPTNIIVLRIPLSQNTPVTKEPLKIWRKGLPPRYLTLGREGSTAAALTMAPMRASAPRPQGWLSQSRHYDVTSSISLPFAAQQRKLSAKMFCVSAVSKRLSGELYSQIRAFPIEDSSQIPKRRRSWF
jgi:hypothetical protein